MRRLKLAAGAAIYRVFSRLVFALNDRAERKLREHDMRRYGRANPSLPRH